MLNYRRLPLEGLENVRDLGGYAVPGGMTSYGVFLRSEVPSALTNSDIAFLRDYGIKTVIDVRGASEVELKPDLLRYEDFVEYIHLPMADRIAAQGSGVLRMRPMDEDFSWGIHYISMCENQKAWVKSVIEAISSAKGGLLFHCTTGKDRTGIISALLLGTCGVDAMDIAADYCVSEIYLQVFYESMANFIPVEMRESNYRPAFFSTDYRNMSVLLEHFNTKYGGIPGYLESCGSDKNTLNIISEKLVLKNS